jgi:HTH-type transcriptional regulator/antitoxin HigA
MQIRSIQSEPEHDTAIARITQLIGSKPGTETSKELESLVTIVDAYEAKHFPMDEPDPETLRRFVAEQQGVSE